MSLVVRLVPTSAAILGSPALAHVAEPPPRIPVTSTEVRKADFPVFFNGLGTVQPYNTVTVRSRVDGQITRVFFEQGQMVKQGDPLVEIDKRP